MKHILFYSLIFALLNSFTSCSQHNEFESSKEIITLLYNYESSLIPAPSIEDFENGLVKPLILQSKNIDSIKYAIVNKCLRDDLKELEIEGLHNDFKKLLKQFNREEGECIMNRMELVDKNGTQIPMVTDDFSKAALESVKERYKVLGIVSFSPIVFNEDGSKALVCFGATREGLDSHWGVYFFEKKNGEWKIFTSKLLSIS